MGFFKGFSDFFNNKDGKRADYYKSILEKYSLLKANNYIKYLRENDERGYNNSIRYISRVGIILARNIKYSKGDEADLEKLEFFNVKLMNLKLDYKKREAFLDSFMALLKKHEKSLNGIFNNLSDKLF